MTAAPALEAVFDKVDAFFDRVAKRYPEDLACSAGCHDCCSAGLTVTPAEAAAIDALLARIAPAERTRIAESARSADASGCAALNAEGRCSIYPVRPLVCRSHGVVVRLPPREKGALPVLDTCPKNFRERELRSVDTDCVLDQQTLSLLLAAVHASSGMNPTARTDLRAILMEAGSAPTTPEEPADE